MMKRIMFKLCKIPIGAPLILIFLHNSHFKKVNIMIPKVFWKYKANLGMNSFLGIAAKSHKKCY